MRCCKTCRFLAVHPDAQGRVVVRAANAAYECAAVVPLPALPDSVTMSYGFRWPMSRRYMRCEEGTLCPTWEPRTPTQDTKEGG